MYEVLKRQKYLIRNIILKSKKSQIYYSNYNKVLTFVGPYITVQFIQKGPTNRDRREDVEGKLISTSFITGLKAQKIYLFAVYYSVPAFPSDTGSPECIKSAGKGI